VSIKRDITRLPNGRWQAIIRFGLADELKVIGRTRADTESVIDRFAEMMADPAQALAVYHYFRSLKARAEAEGLEVAGDLFTRDGIFNADAKATGQMSSCALAAGALSRPASCRYVRPFASAWRPGSDGLTRNAYSRAAMASW
jgi:hypothetical protein